MAKSKRKATKRRPSKGERARAKKQTAGRRPTKAKGASPDAEKGYEFGIPVHVMAASLPTFVNDLGQAKVMACAYGFQSYGDLGPLPFVALVARNPSKLNDALIDLEKRAKPLGGDAVGVGMLFQPTGEFRISISIDPDDLRLRLFPGNYLHVPLAVAASWLFDLKSSHPHLAEIRRWKQKNPLFPVLLAGATSPASGQLQPVGPVVPVFNMEFADNGTGSSATLFPTLGVVAQGRQQDHGPEKYSAQDICDRRLTVLTRYFPITCRRTGLVAPSRADAEWERLQAICNLTVSHEMTGAPFYVGISGDEISGKLEEHLRSRVETHAVELSAFSDGDIDHQVALDRASREAYVNS
jgi:hypothetical protein